MPINIIEEDNTQVKLTNYNNFTVAIAGLVSTDEQLSAFENGILEINSQSELKEKVGLFDAKGGNQYGNQIAYELLGLGYKLIYKAIGSLEGDNFTGKSDSALATAINQVISEDTFWVPLLDKSNYDFRYIMNGLTVDNAKANNAISKIASTRGDCTALIDVDEAILTVTTDAALIESINEKVGEYTEANEYTAICLNPVIYSMPVLAVFNENKKFPASFHYLACAAHAANDNYAEYYAVAGMTRGISKYRIENTVVPLGEMAIQALQPRTNENGATKAVNAVIKIRKKYYFWGNRTAKKLGTELKASHFLNIRQLCTTIKKQAYFACKLYTFDPNSDVLWINVTSALTPMLEQMKANEGIYDYKIVKDKSDHKAQLKFIIRIIPIEAVEDFDIKLSLEDSFGEPVTVITEVSSLEA